MRPGKHDNGMNLCPLCNSRPNLGGYSIHCECGLNIVMVEGETKRAVVKRWNKLHTGDAMAAAKIAQQRKEIEALSRLTKC